MISANQLANLQLVEQRRINQAYLSVKPDEPPPLAPLTPSKVDVLMLQDLGIGMNSAAAVNPVTTGAAASAAVPAPPVQLTEKLPAQIQLRAPTTVAPYEINKPADVKQARLNDEFQL